MTHAAHTRPGIAAHAAPLTEPLALYLNDHLLRATSGSELARRIAKQHAMSPAGQTLVRVADDVAQDRAALLRIMSDLGVPVRLHKIFTGWLLEKAGRARTNGLLVRRAPLSSVLELEALRLGVERRRLMWQALRSLSRSGRNSGLDEGQLTDLVQRATNQAEVLEELQLQAATGVLKQH
jgi:hypothetical protein